METNFMQKRIEEIKKFFNEKKQSWDSIYQYKSLPVIAIEISDGDWKHDHLCCKWLMEQKGYKQIGEEQVGKETGGDWYSSIHYFMIG